MKTILALVLAAVMASACADGPARRDDRDVLAKYDGYIGEPIRGFTALRTDSWQPVRHDRLILWTSLNDAYLITLHSPCTDLMFAHRIGVTSVTSQISTFDSVLVGRDRCPIKQINPIDIRQMKADRKADQKS